MKHKLIATSILAGAILSYSFNTLADTQKFPDVPKWAEQSVNYLVDKQVLIGYPDGTFGSHDLLDRASATKIMTKVLGIQIDFDAKPSFTDSQNHWATPYIAAAEKAGIIKGEGNGVFNPSGKVTRAAMATMLVNAYKLQSTTNNNDQSKFEDLKGHWGERFANILIDLKISVGTDNGWQPNRFITRAEAAQLTAKSDQIQKNTNKQVENSARADSISKVDIEVNKQVENSTRADSVSKVKQSTTQSDKLQNNTTQPFIEKNNKQTGKVIEKGSKYLIVKQGDVTIKTNVRKKVLENINIGDIVHIYAESFTGSNLPTKEQTLYAHSSIVQKIGEPIDSNYIKFTGEVVSKDGNYLVVSNGKMKMSARTSSKVIEEINIGDTVNIYTTTVVGGMIGISSAGSSVIEKYL
ncbi:S-layer homology domain-containing protein [Bacillus cereus]|uniref:S-layer homology domain-containing protein n=1 Tax=Bacillus cereus TaxID=1396 RepID=UPI0018F647DE|nr:S-layer homology domain-containing protein [Bacillus cereus]MBJ8154304.1 S-layer homology domain-containing protein [Bacillus cereus]